MKLNRIVVGITLVLIVLSLSAVALREPKPSGKGRDAQANSGASTSAIERRVPAEALPNLTSRDANTLERSQDLSALYRRFEGAQSPFERELARRAWSACFPTFLGSNGRVADVESFVRAMPQAASSNAARAEAYRSLYQRCSGFFHLSSEEIAELTQRMDGMANRGEAASVGELAFKHWREGDEDRARELARTAITSRDGHAIASLQEYVHRSLERRIDEGTFPKGERTDWRALAFALAACDFGFDCSVESLTALQLCTNNAKCDGDLRERYLQLLEQPSERDQLRAIVRRTAEAITKSDLAALGLDKP